MRELHSDEGGGGGGQDKTNHSEQILSLILKGQWDCLSPEGKLESHLAECLLALTPAFAGRSRLRGQTEGTQRSPASCVRRGQAGQGVSAASL